MPSHGMYIRDAWQISRKLTIDYGIRYAPREVIIGVPTVIRSWRLVPRCLLEEVHEVWPDGRAERVSSTPVGVCPIGPMPRLADISGKAVDLISRRETWELATSRP